jgi:hypothetical protein
MISCAIHPQSKFSFLLSDMKCNIWFQLLILKIGFFPLSIYLDLDLNGHVLIPWCQI